jgi:RNA polymerase sigma-70 factor (ECF subfamily)
MRETYDTPWCWSALRRISLQEAHRLLGDPHDAEDAAQEAAIRAWRQRDACRRTDDPGPWVRQIARREALRLTARRRPAALEAGEVPAPGEHPAEGLHERIDVQRALRTLDEGDRTVLVARYALDLKQRTIAEALGIPEGTAKVRLHRARARLRDALLAA